MDMISKGKSQYEYENVKKLAKLASATGKETTYTNGILDVEKDKLTNDTIHYRIMLNVDKDKLGSLTVTDTLPKGMSYKEGSMNVMFYGNEWGTYPSSGSYDFSNDKYKPTVDVATKDDQTILTFHIKDGYENDQNQKIVIDYEVIVTDDPAWKDMTIEKKSYTNSVKWDNHEDSQTTNVKRPVEVVHKKGEQLKDANGQYTNTIEYSVEINTAGKVLNPKGDSVTFSDALTVEDGVKAYLDLQNVKLYKFDSNAENHRSSTEIDSSSYSLKYDEKTYEISGELPDATPCVLVYRYNIDKGNKGTPTISNEAELAGSYTAKDSGKMQSNSAEMTDSTTKVTIRKVDADNYAKGLPGAEFSVEEYLNGWITPEAYRNKQVTDSKGEAVLNTYEPGKLYRIKETKAPADYTGDSNYCYFMITSNQDNSTAQSALDADYKNLPANMQDPNDKMNYVDKSKIRYFCQNGGEIIVPNEYTQLTVNKTWQNADGSKADKPGENFVDVKLYRYIKKPDGIKVTLITDNSYKNISKEFAVDSGSTFTVEWGAI